MDSTQGQKKVFFGASVFDSKTHSFLPATVVTHGENISAVLPATEIPLDGECIDCRGMYMIPGLVDMHTHGRAGLDFVSASEESLSSVLLDYARAGTTSLLPTLATAEYEAWCTACRILTKHAKSRAGGAHILGVHLEGRYLSPEKRGAHDEKLLTDPSTQELSKLCSLLDGVHMHITVAPERTGCEAFIREAKKRSATVGIGHTSCTYEQACKAVQWGAEAFTHTFNAMSRIHHRAPGCTTAALLTDAYAELICDGIHSHPAMTSLLTRAKTHDRIVLVTDSIAAAGLSDGAYMLGTAPITVKDRCATTADGAIAGSTISLFEGVKNCMRYASLPLEAVLPFATENPARLLGISDALGKIAPGMRADLLLIDKREGPSLLSVVCGGNRIR